MLIGSIINRNFQDLTINEAVNQEFLGFNLNTNFWLFLFLNGFLFAIANIAMNTAFKISDLSVTVPILNFIPIFTLILEVIFFKNSPSLISIIGVFIVVLGSYFLKFDFQNQNFFSPFKALFKDPGVLLMFLVAFVWALDNLLSREGSVSSNPYVWTIAVRLVTIIFIYPLVLYKKIELFRLIKENFLSLFFIGAIVGISVTITNFLLTQASPTLISTLVRSSSIFSVIYGYLWFKEINIYSKITGAVIMILGIVLISFNI